MLMKKLCSRVRIPSLLLFLVLVTLALFLFLRQGHSHLEKSGVVLSSPHKSRYRLIVIVLSSQDNLRQRYAIRKTWLSEKNNQVRHLFAIGTSNLEPEQLVTLRSEETKYGDLLLLPNIPDSYNTLTKKVLHTFKHVVDNYEFDYLIKCDDDTYVVLYEILQQLADWDSSVTGGKHLYWGFFNGKATVKKNGPWREPDWIFCDYYLPYALGGGYVLSKGLVDFIAKNKDSLKLYNSEDVSVGLWLAPVANVERKHDFRFDTEYRSRGCSNQYIVTHKRTVEDMKSLHDNLQNTGVLCAKEFSNRMSYQYNWTVPPSQCCYRQPGLP